MSNLNTVTTGSISYLTNKSDFDIPEKPNTVDEVVSEIVDAENSEEAPKWLPKRLTRERKTALKEFAKTHGFEDVNTLIDFIETARQEKPTIKEEEEKVETEDKPQIKEESLVLLENRLKEMEDRLKQEKQEKTKSQVEKRIIENVAKQAEFPDDVVKRVFEVKPFSDFVDEKGDINETALNEAINNVRKERPNFFRKTFVGSPSNKVDAIRPEDEKVREYVQKIDNSIRRAF